MECKVCGDYEPRKSECLECGGEGYIDHDCGEDCCACAFPEPNVPCDYCGGIGIVDYPCDYVADGLECPHEIEALKGGE